MFKFFAWNEIEEVILEPKGFMVKSFWKGGIKPAHQLKILIKNKKKPITISEHWIEDIGTPYSLIVRRWLRNA